MKFSIVSLLFFLLCIPVVSAVSPNDQVIATKVVSVVDGDTFKVNIDGEEESVRILGIDAPELSQGGKNSCGGEAAKSFMKNLIEGKSVLLLRSADSNNRDAFGRLLRIVKIRERLDVSILLLATGNAAVYRKTTFSGTNFYEKLEQAAKRKQLGIWSARCSVVSKNDDGGFMNDSNCGSKKYCSQMSSCKEAKKYLLQCGLKSLDSDGDGIPCEALCGVQH